MGNIKYFVKIGDKFNKLTIIDQVRVFKKNSQLSKGLKWVCVCECGGSPKPCTSYDLVNDKVVSCGICSKQDAGTFYRKEGTLNPSKSVWRNYRQTAKRRGLEFDLDYNFFMSIIIQSCVYCGSSEVSYFNPRNDWEQQFRYTGIDRINSSVGYLKENIQPCCKHCNMSKSDRTEKDFYEWIEKVYNKMKSCEEV